MSVLLFFWLSWHICVVIRGSLPLVSLPSESGEQEDVYEKPHNQYNAQPERYQSVFRKSVVWRHKRGHHANGPQNRSHVSAHKLGYTAIHRPIHRKGT